MADFSVREVFVQCQDSVQCHPKLVKLMKKVYASMDYEQFWKEFIFHVKHAMIIFKREPAVELVINFVALFATSCQSEADKENVGQENAEAEEEAADQEMNKLLIRLFDFLLTHHKAVDKAVRFRSCQLINKLLNHLGEDAQINDDMYDRIYESMQQRLNDKIPLVRVQAVLALARLQDPTDLDCPVINAYMFLLGNDPIHYVRKAVLSCIAAAKQTLPAMLDRTLDISPAVRKLAYNVMSEKIHIKALTIAQRVQLLDRGLNDRDETVKDACTSRMLQAWLRVHEGNILDLLWALDVENSLDTSKQALLATMKKTSPEQLLAGFDLLNDNLVISQDKLSCESTLYWKTLCEHLKSLEHDGMAHLDKVMPTPFKFAKMLQRVLSVYQEEPDLDKQLSNEFCLQQLLELACLLDLTDEAGRKELNKVVTEALGLDWVSAGLVKPLLGVYCILQQDDHQRVNTLVEIISDIREPITVVEKTLAKEEQRQLELKMAGIRVELNQLRDEMDVAISGQDFTGAAKIKERVDQLETEKTALQEQSQPQSQEIRTEKTDPATLVKCLTIASEMLQDVRFKTLSPTLLTLIESLILPGIQNDDAAVRNVAVKALGLCCQICLSSARNHMILFLQVSQIDEETVKITALKVIFDLLHTFGLEAFEAGSSDVDSKASDDTSARTSLDIDDASEKEENEVGAVEKESSNTANSLLNILIGFLDSQSFEVRTVAAEGLAKLLLSGRVISSRIFSRLILLWYNPITEEDSHLRECLGAFFPIFAFSGRTNQQIVEEAFLPTLNTLFNAPATSPLAEVNVANVAKLMAHLTNARNLLENQRATTASQMKDTGIHYSLAEKVCNEILDNPNSFSVRVLSKVLMMLDLNNAEVSDLKELDILADRMTQEVKDKLSGKDVEGFKKNISQLITIKSTTTEVPHIREDLSQEEAPEDPFDEPMGPQGDATQGSQSDMGAESQGEMERLQPPSQELSQPVTEESQTSKTSQVESTTSTSVTSPKLFSSTTESQASNVSKQKKGKKGKKKETRQVTRSRSTRSQAAEEAEPSTDSDIENNAKSTPTPVRRPSRKKKAAKRPSDDDELCRKLAEMLSDDESPASFDKNLIVNLERIPLSDVENQVI